MEVVQPLQQDTVPGDNTETPRQEPQSMHQEFSLPSTGLYDL